MHMSVITAWRVLWGSDTAGCAAPTLGVGQRVSGTEQLSGADTGFAWIPLQHTPMTHSRRDLNMLSPSSRSLLLALSLEENSEGTQAHMLSKVKWKKT